MRIATLAVLLGGFALILFAIGSVFQVSVNVGPTITNNGSFAARLERPVRLAIVGEANRANALRAEILQADNDGLIDHNTTPSEPEDADAIVFLLDGWDEIMQAPWQDRFSSDYMIVADSEEDSFSLSMADGDRPLNRTYYNLGYYSDWGLDCYAALLLHDIGGAPGASIVMPSNC
ncbi:hypothetical protein QTO30_10960 [Yoonia sp. GPGPB17]|uniref:hypothetical protein n=1 Tax=Yoonia sp. GPGPB17 TaxID=3026147 RepID=UPI0030BE4FB7